MKIQRVKSEDELPQFGHYSDDIFLDGYLWRFICEVKELAISNRDPYFPQMFMDECLIRMKERFEERGPLPEGWPKNV